MNLQARKNERKIFDSALRISPGENTDQKPVEYRLSSTHKQSFPYLNAVNPFGTNVVQFAVKSLSDYEIVKSPISKNVLAAMAGDPDPIATLADIRKLLVGPTHRLHDAMFEEVITILEESDLAIQKTMQSLMSRCTNLTKVTNELASSSVESRDQNRMQSEYLLQEIQKSATAQEEMLNEMFLAIDKKIDQVTSHFYRDVEKLSQKIEANLRVTAAHQDKCMRELEARCLARSETSANLLANRIADLENRAGSDQVDLHEIFAEGLSSLADRLKALQQRHHL